MLKFSKFIQNSKKHFLTWYCCCIFDEVVSQLLARVYFRHKKAARNTSESPQQHMKITKTVNLFPPELPVTKLSKIKKNSDNGVEIKGSDFKGMHFYRGLFYLPC